MFELPALPFDPESMGSFTSAETFSYHHGKHHAGYVKKLNAAVEGSNYEGLPLMEVIISSRDSEPGVFNNAAQHFNHSFFWECLTPEAQEPEGALKEAIEKSFGSLDGFKQQFADKAATLFGSGWAWLVQQPDGSLSIEQYNDADTPEGTEQRPLLTLDVWEHAYYLDHQNDRGAFIAAFWDHVNWSAVAARLA